MMRIARFFVITLIFGLLAPFSLIARDLPVTTVGGRECYIYDVKKGENIYDVSRELGLPTVEITRYNPSAADGLRTGMRLYIPTSLVNKKSGVTTSRTSTPPVTVPAARTEATNPATATHGVETYTVKRGESLYGISHKFNISMEELIALNPSAEYGVKAGDVLVIKAADNVASAQPEANDTTEPEIDPVMPYDDPDKYSLIPSEERISRQYIVAVGDSLDDLGHDIDTLNMAVILPFMLHSAQQDKNAQLFVEFYKGLLLAADSLKNAPGHFINIYAYDSAASADSVSAIMRRPEMADMNLIIGPDNEAQLQIIADYMMSGTHLYNTFNVRSNLYAGNPRVMQANIPHSPMLEKAVDAFSEMYRSYTPVFLSRIDGAADKDAFTSLLKQRLDNDSVGYREITFRNLLSHRDLDTLSVERNYVFVPVSGSRAEFAKISEAIRRFGDSRPSNSTRLFGYPDWIIFRGEYFNRLCDLEATIYTRFYADMKNPETAAVTDQFRHTYGTDMLDAAPVQGLLGFDTGMYLISALKDYGKEFADHLGPYTGLQSVMNLEQKPGEGEVNNALIIVTFGPGGNVIKTTLE